MESKGWLVCTMICRLLHYGGLDIPNLCTEQLVTQLSMLLWHGQCTTITTSILLRASVKALKLEARISGKFSKLPLAYQDLTTNTWLKYLWGQFQQLDIHLLMDIPDFTPQWKNIKVIRLSSYRGSELVGLNQCCMYLHAIWLLALCCSCGQELSHLARTGTMVCDSPYVWPVIPKPLANKRNKWQCTFMAVLGLDCWKKLLAFWDLVSYGVKMGLVSWLAGNPTVAWRQQWASRRLHTLSSIPGELMPHEEELVQASVERVGAFIWLKGIAQY